MDGQDGNELCRDEGGPRNMIEKLIPANYMIMFHIQYNIPYNFPNNQPIHVGIVLYE